MSSHHSRAFILRHYEQQSNARARREQKAIDRQESFLLRREDIRSEVKLWQFCLAIFGAVWFLYCAAMSVAYATWLV